MPGSLSPGSVPLPIRVGRAPDLLSAGTMPTTRRVMLIRHAEEPDKDAGIQGVDEQGHPDQDALSVRGWQRAGALVRLFVPQHAGVNANHRLLAPPVALFAATDPYKSHRPLCTVLPLARLLGLQVDTRFGSDSSVTALLTTALAYRGPVLLCWRHQAMSDIAQALCGRARRWNEARYDLVWVFERQGEAWQLTEVPQRVLDGDG